MKRLLVLLALVVAATPAAAQRSLAIKQFDAAVAVNQDGTVDVTETITVQFSGKWNGVYRTVPVQYHTPQGFSWTLRLEDVSATDGQGTPLKVEQQRERHYMKYKLWVPGAEDATRTVVFHYRAVNGLRFFEDHDELYWNLTGDEWDVPIEAVSALIQLPQTATGVRAIAFNGAYGSTAQDAEVAIEGHTVRVTMPQPARLPRGRHGRGWVGQGRRRGADRRQEDDGFPGNQLAACPADPRLRGHAPPLVPRRTGPGGASRLGPVRTALGPDPRGGRHAPG